MHLCNPLLKKAIIFYFSLYIILCDAFYSVIEFGVFSLNNHLCAERSIPFILSFIWKFSIKEAMEDKNCMGHDAQEVNSSQVYISMISSAYYKQICTCHIGTPTSKIL